MGKLHNVRIGLWVLSCILTACSHSKKIVGSHYPDTRGLPGAYINSLNNLDTLILLRDSGRLGSLPSGYRGKYKHVVRIGSSLEITSAIFQTQWIDPMPGHYRMDKDALQTKAQTKVSDKCDRCYWSVGLSDFRFFRSDQPKYVGLTLLYADSTNNIILSSRSMQYVRSDSTIGDYIKIDDHY
jgi:hypothetical protein